MGYCTRRHCRSCHKSVYGLAWRGCCPLCGYRGYRGYDTASTYPVVYKSRPLTKEDRASGKYKSYEYRKWEPVNGYNEDGETVTPPKHDMTELGQCIILMCFIFMLIILLVTFSRG